MKYVFFGTPHFADIILAKLIKSGLPPILVVCNPDSPVGRKKVITPPPTKVTSEKDNIKVYQPSSLGVDGLRSLASNAEFALLAAYGNIISQEIIDLFSKGVIGVHPSLLPKYRGATPIQSAILEGEEKTGVTLYLMDEEVDHGPIIAQESINILSNSYLELEERLAELSVQMIIKHVPDYISGKVKPKAQTHNEATFTNKFFTKDAEINFDDLIEVIKFGGEKAQQINQLIRALNPEPGTWTMSENSEFQEIPENKRIKLLGSEIKDGKLILNKIQVAGKNPKIVNIKSKNEKR